MMETTHVLRGRIVAKSEFVGDGRDECVSRQTSAKILSEEFTQRISELGKQEKIIVASPELGITKHHQIVLRKLQNCIGYVRTVSACPYCRGGRVSSCSEIKCPSCSGSFKPIERYQYKALGHADLEHAYLAKYAGASLFYSTDKSFRDLIGNPDFDSITFKII